ncbi:hypothetical protein [Helicobacter pylori]|uniref:Uncharacterized protein n=1 Tax=Helicobacter pylori (strain B8) TaxID=693745 RepID=D7FEC3_HELP3|nr:hypothetical protein [Helicobacter pylori]AHZ25299.1 hypothetical protein EG65_03190 [Helicobacter pylori J166]AVG73801.1 hypothetical protein BXP01_04655 [Helicobacter pylori]AVG79849.1 hypothetical protein BXP12_04650 [Helicobacter pylori]AVG81319.1 hypothetical protein BXP17_04655 [Helicobacter pylori]AVG82724.1 hypothetical protein BXP20_04695 [Helicobacter pylori]
MEKNDRYAIVTNVIEPLEKGGSFNQRDREKFAQAARTHGIEDSVIEEVIDITQTISLIHLHEDRLDASDLPREQKKAMRAELQKSIDENLEALKSIRNSILVRDRLPMWSLLLNENWLQEILKNKNNI